MTRTELNQQSVQQKPTAIKKLDLSKICQGRFTKSSYPVLDINMMASLLKFSVV